AGLPIGFRELGKLFFKCTLVQLPLVMLFTVAGSLLVSYVAGFRFPPVVEIMFGVKAAFLLCASRFIFMGFAFSSGTNDNTGFKIRVPILLAVMVGSGLLFLLLAAAGLFAPKQGAWLLVGIAIIEAYCFFRIYGWFYHVCRFDLMKLP